MKSKKCECERMATKGKKTPKMPTGDRAIAQVKNLKDDLDKANYQKALAQQEKKELEDKQKKTNKLRDRAGARYESVLKKLDDQSAIPRKLSLDGTASTGAQVFHEGWGYLMRLLAEAAEKVDPAAWTVENIDALQAIPSTIVGLAAYMIELVTRPRYIKDKEGKDTDTPYLPSWGREWWSKFGEILFNLGFSNISRMARYRLSQNIDERVEAKRALKVSEAESEAVKVERDALLKKVGELEAAARRR